MPSVNQVLTGIPDEDIQYAYALGNKYGLPAGEDGKNEGGGLGNKGDAARHIALGYLAALADKNRGTYGFSKSLAQARELSPLTRRNVDSKMDMHNNRIGMQLAILVGDDRQAFERYLDGMIKNSRQVKSVDDFGEQYSSMIPVYITPGYRTYTGGPSASTNTEDIKTVPGITPTRKP